MERNRGWGKVSGGSPAADLEGKSEFAGLGGQRMQHWHQCGGGKEHWHMLQEPQTGHVTPGAGPLGDMAGRTAGGKQPRGLLSEGPRVLRQ